MNRPDVTILLRRLSIGFGRKAADTETIDEWRRVLDDIEAQEAFTALDRIMAAGEPGPSASRLIAEIRTRVPVGHREPPPIGAPDCGMCDGTGYMLTRDPAEPDVDRMAPCAICRPDDGWHKRRHPSTHTPEPQRVLLMDGAEERKAAWRHGEAAYVAVLRRQFPPTPGLTETDLRDRMRRIPPLPGYGTHRPPDSPPAAS